MSDDTFCCGNAKIYGKPSELSVRLDRSRTELAAVAGERDKALRDVDRYKMMHRVAEDQLNDKLIQLQERDARYANDKRDADGDPASLCNICKGMIRYGERHSTCGAAFMELERQLATVTAERDALSQDDGKVERALESKQVECDRITQQVAATTAAYDRINGRCLGFMDQVDSIARSLDCGHSAIDIIAAIKSIRDERDVFTAALAEVRGESVSLENMRRDLNNHKRYVFADHPLQPTDGKALLAHTDALLSLVNSLQLAEAANRNGFAQAKAREQGLREQVANLEKSLAHWQHCHGVTADTLVAAESRARELGEAISQAVRLIDEFETRTSTAWPTTVKITKLLQSALAPAPSPPTEHNPLDCEQCWLPQGDQKS